MIKNKLQFALYILLSFFQTVYGQSSAFEAPVQNQEWVQQSPSFEEDYFLNEPDRAPATKEKDNFQAKFLNMLFILGLLVGFMILASWALKKMMRSRLTQINQVSAIKVLETRQLSPKSALYLIEVEGQALLIGESQTGLTHLASFSSETFKE